MAALKVSNYNHLGNREVSIRWRSSKPSFISNHTGNIGSIDGANIQVAAPARGLTLATHLASRNTQRFLLRPTHGPNSSLNDGDVRNSSSRYSRHAYI